MHWLFFSLLFDMPSVFGVTGHLVNGCYAAFCRQAEHCQAGTGAVSRNVKTAALCKAALNACCHHL